MNNKTEKDLFGGGRRGRKNLSALSLQRAVHIQEMERLIQKMRLQIRVHLREMREWQSLHPRIDNARLRSRSLQDEAMRRHQLRASWLIYRRAMEDYADLLSPLNGRR